MAKLTKCRACGREIGKPAKACPHCGARGGIGLPFAVLLILLTVPLTVVGLLVLQTIF